MQCPAALSRKLSSVLLPVTAFTAALVLQEACARAETAQAAAEQQVTELREQNALDFQRIGQLSEQLDEWQLAADDATKCALLASLGRQCTVTALRKPLTARSCSSAHGQPQLVLSRRCGCVQSPARGGGRQSHPAAAAAAAAGRPGSQL